jgi:hypothetical protein
MDETRPRSKARGQLFKMEIKEAPEPTETPEEIEARHSQQWLLIQETLYTEKSYVKSLRQLVGGEVKLIFSRLSEFFSVFLKFFCFHHSRVSSLALFS